MIKGFDQKIYSISFLPLKSKEAKKNTTETRQ